MIVDFDKFIDKYGLSPSSPEAYYAELAANEVDKSWFVASDRKPKDGDYVLVFAPKRMFSRCDIDVCQYTEKYGFDVGCVEMWMPLPESPCKN